MKFKIEYADHVFILGYCFPNFYEQSILMNKAVREGTLDVPMNVTGISCAVTLSVVSTTEEFHLRKIFGSDCTEDSTLANLYYYVNGSGLTIRNATTTENGQPISTAGLYIAECNDGSRTGQKLVVVRKYFSHSYGPINSSRVNQSMAIRRNSRYECSS